ncbi:hypothetical protein OAP17_09120, partial [Porticoccaceae bacterium]|nr:hypothetical protein [Porticoccaceae bacterium]
MKKTLLLLDQAMVSGSAFLVTVLISNLFGSEAVGEYSLFLMAIQLPLMFQMALVINPMMSSLINEEAFTYINQVLVLLIAFTSLLTMSVLEYREFGLISWTNIVYFFVPIYILKFEFDRRRLFYESKLWEAFFLDFCRCTILIISLFVIQETNMYATYGYFCFIFILMLSCCLSLLLNGGGLKSLLIFQRSEYLPIKDIMTSLQHSYFLVTAGGIQWGLASFPYLMVNFLFGTEKLGVIREIQNLTGTLNVLYQSLENYFPKAIASELKRHGEKSALRYVIKLSVLAGV